jgi:hypothetical protein
MHNKQHDKSTINKYKYAGAPFIHMHAHNINNTHYARYN